MAGHHRPYPAEFRQRMLELVRAGRKPDELAKEFELSAQTIWNWVKQADLGPRCCTAPRCPVLNARNKTWKLYVNVRLEGRDADAV